MKAYAIVLKECLISERGFEKLYNSNNDHKNDFDIEKFNAVEPKDVDYLMNEFQLNWTWPWKKFWT